jgi:hypothetical protein
MNTTLQSDRRSLPANRAVRVLPGAVAALLALGLAGCAARMERATVAQAAYDFKCSADEISLVKVAFAEYRATGCGKTTSYQLIGECYFDWNPCHAARLGEIDEVRPPRSP